MELRYEDRCNMDVALRDNNHHGELQRIRSRSVLRVSSLPSRMQTRMTGEREKKKKKLQGKARRVRDEEARARAIKKTFERR